MIILKQDAIEKYRKVSEKIIDPVLLCKLRNLFERNLSLAELLEWLHEKVKWSKGNIIRHRDPLEILAYGKGKCGEFSILFICCRRADSCAISSQYRTGTCEKRSLTLFKRYFLVAKSYNSGL